MKKSAFTIKPGSKPKLSDYDPDDTGEFPDEALATAVVEEHRKRLDELQQLMTAENKHSLLVVLQSMDAGGKDGVIRHIFSGISPQGCQVASFKVPTEEERRHDFLWRIHWRVPPLGIIGIFNRSHYEDVLVTRVHGEIGKGETRRRFDEINAFEHLLFRSGTTVLKFFLHISNEEQRQRLQERIDEPKKNWKISQSDLEERKRWDLYMDAYEDAFRHTSTKAAPWYVIPANHKWARNAIISHILITTMESLKMKYPKPSFDVSKVKVE